MNGMFRVTTHQVQLVRAILTRQLGIELGIAELGDEDDEYAPVVVEM